MSVLTGNDDDVAVMNSYCYEHTDTQEHFWILKACTFLYIEMRTMKNKPVRNLFNRERKLYAQELRRNIWPSRRSNEMQNRLQMCTLIMRSTQCDTGFREVDI